MGMVEVTLMGLVEEVGVVVCCKVDECGLQGKGERERERELGHEVEHGFFDVRLMVQDQLLTYSALSSTSTVPDFVQPKIRIRDAGF